MPRSVLSQSIFILFIFLAGTLLYAGKIAAQPGRKQNLQCLNSVSQTREMKDKEFTIRFSEKGMSSLRKTGDVHPTDYVRKGKAFTGVVIRYLSDGKWDSVKTSSAARSMVTTANNQIQYATGNDQSALRLTEGYTLKADGLIWTIRLENRTAQPIRVGDLEIPIFYNNQGGEDPEQIFEQRVIKHHVIAGNNSFLFWQRPTGLGPYLVMIPDRTTSLEYFSSKRKDDEIGQFNTYIHSARSGGGKGDWRQAHTAAVIPGKGSRLYSFKFRWAQDYQAIRNMLVAEGLIDVQVMPGMTVPVDLNVTIALRSGYQNLRIKPEFGEETVLKALPGRQAGTELYQIRFSRLGENKITITYGNQQHTLLEFFVTEPLETLYKKRATFIAGRQQHVDPSKWYNGLFSVYDMKHQVLRGPDNADGFDQSRLSYVTAADDPVLGKAPFLAAKNVFYPDQQQINAIEYYVKHFLWGGLQRTDKEQPNAYGLYGTPNWLVNRDSLNRSQNLHDVNKDKMHIWRSYDYPHIIMLYFELYKIAKLHPGMTHELDQDSYLERAKETAKAYFKYPYEILPWYETYKWGCYNELVLVELIAELEKKGFTADAAYLRKEWEKKVKYFIYDDPYPFRSEYAVDATAYESTHAFAKYAATNPLLPDTNLWFDKNKKVWYSHPRINKGDALNFMKREIAANIASRGWLETSFYYYGSDFRGSSDSFTLSYMSQMGGGAILDDALNFSTAPADEFRLGYGAYLSSFALINSGTAKSNYGYWYPGKENDGAAGWAFEPQEHANTWINKPQGRGPWYYDGEIDLGFGGATRSAATIITDDPVFGTVAYGGNLKQQGKLLSVVPRDGIRARFYAHAGGEKIDLVLMQDGFAAEREICVATGRKAVSFVLENRTGTAHETELLVSGLDGLYRLKVQGQPDKEITLQKGKDNALHIALSAPLTLVAMEKAD